MQTSRNLKGLQSSINFLAGHTLSLLLECTDLGPPEVNLRGQNTWPKEGMQRELQLPNNLGGQGVSLGSEDGKVARTDVMCFTAAQSCTTSVAPRLYKMLLYCLPWSEGRRSFIKRT